MNNLRLTWRSFWSRRSRSRIALTCALVAVTLLAIVWLVLPPDWRLLAQADIALFAYWVSSLDTTTLLVALIGLCVVETLVLLFVPSYRKYPYLATAPSLIPSVSVYLDAENQHPERAIRPFMKFLHARLNGERADLFFFQSATKGATKPAYRTLRLSGFQPIDVPHDPTGKNEIEEAVDREIAMHAFERALFGPDNQLFIIISQDGDYVPLVYRLVSLGHRVEIWASEPPKAYAEAQKFINVVPDDPGAGRAKKGKKELRLALLRKHRLDVVDLAREIPEFGKLRGQKVARAQQKMSAPAITVGNEQLGRKPSSQESQTGTLASQYRSIDVLTIPSAISTRGEQELQRAILCSIETRRDVFIQDPAGEASSNFIRGVLGSRMKPFLMRIGYSDGTHTNLKYWLYHLNALHIFDMANEDSIPDLGVAFPEDAAHRMFAMALITADVTMRIASTKPMRVISMHKIADAIASTRFEEGEPALPLIRLIAPDNVQRGMHTRMFVRCARALGLLDFDDDPVTQDRILRPRVLQSLSNALANQVHSATSESPEAEMGGKPGTNSGGNPTLD